MGLSGGFGFAPKANSGGDGEVGRLLPPSPLRSQILSPLGAESLSPLQAEEDMFSFCTSGLSSRTEKEGSVINLVAYK